MIIARSTLHIMIYTLSLDQTMQLRPKRATEKVARFIWDPATRELHTHTHSKHKEYIYISNVFGNCAH